MTDKLAGKVALVTGGSAGIGLGIAKRFAHEGARVFITGRHQSQLDQAVASIGGYAAAIQADSSTSAISTMYSHPLSPYLGDREQLQQSGLLKVVDPDTAISMIQNFSNKTSEAPPDERGGNRYVRPTATAPHPDSTREPSIFRCDAKG
jgi:NAD(P)-dependent dehydrogenase (short-subunit alcohol dehydrogenase family)